MLQRVGHTRKILAGTVVTESGGVAQRVGNASYVIEDRCAEAAGSGISGFTTDQRFRHILGQQRSGFSLLDAMDRGRWVILNLDKGRLGEQASTLGSLLLKPAIETAKALIGEVDRIALMDAFLPGVGDWRNVWLMRDLWHFHFYGKTPLALVRGRERIYFEHFWNDFAANAAHSVPERDRRIYAKAYARPGGMRAGFEYFRAFEKDAEDFVRLAQTTLTMPMLVLTGGKASGEFLIQQARLVAKNVEGVVVRNSGHWLMEEAPDQVIPRLVQFINR